MVAELSKHLVHIVITNHTHSAVLVEVSRICKSLSAQFDGVLDSRQFKREDFLR